MFKGAWQTIQVVSDMTKRIAFVALALELALLTVLYLSNERGALMFVNIVAIAVTVWLATTTRNA